MNPFGNLIPGINVGNILKTYGAWTTGQGLKDYDVIDGISVSGGQRNPAPGQWVGPTYDQKVQSAVTNTPAANNQSNLNSPSYNPGGSSGSAGGGSSANDANVSMARLQLEEGIRQNQDALNRIDGQLNTALGNIGSQYNQAYNRLTGSQAAATRDYNTNVTNQEKDYLNAREGIQTNAAARLANARRILGINGAGGGSADRFAVPNVVQQNAANDNAGVQQTNARNLASLATAKEDNDRKFKNSFDDLSSQRESSERNTRSQFEQQRASILDSIAQLTGQNSILNGGNYQSALAAAAPYRNRVAGILNTIDSLAANPAVLRENAPTLTTASLADYINPRTNLPAQTGRVAQDTSLSPAIAALLGYDQEQRQLI